MEKLKRMLNRASVPKAEDPPITEEPRQPDPHEIREVLDEQEAIAGVDTAIAEVVEAMRGNREEIIKTLHARATAGECPQPGSPLEVLQGSRRRMLDQMRATRSSSQGQAGGVLQIDQLNEALAQRLRELTAELNTGSISARLFILQLRAEMENYLGSVEKLLNPVKIQFS